MYKTRNPYHRRDMLSTSIKFPIVAGNSETTTTPQYHRSQPARNERWGEIKDVERPGHGTTNEVHPMAYTMTDARQSIPAICIQEDMLRSKNGR